MCATEITGTITEMINSAFMRKTFPDEKTNCKRVWYGIR